MREIKYRAFFNKVQKMIYSEDFEEFSFYEQEGITHIHIKARTDFKKGGWYSTIDGFTSKKTVIPGTTRQVPRMVVLEYTGLKDKNGVEVYEDDICNFYGRFGIDRGIIKFLRHGFHIVLESDAVFKIDEFHLEVIGNIHEGI